MKHTSPTLSPSRIGSVIRRFAANTLAVASIALLQACGGGGGGGAVAPEMNANLSALTLSVGTISPTFNASTLNYTVTTGSAIASTTVTATTAVAGATLTVNGLPAVSGVATAPINLATGANAIPIVVTSQDLMAVKTYTLTVTRQAESFQLSSLSLSAGVLAPAFTGANATYTISAIAGTPSTTVTATPADLSATFTVNGLPGTAGQASAPISLDPGENTISIIVTAPNAQLFEYQVTVSLPVPFNFVQRGYIKATNTEGVDAFGTSIAVSGNTLVVGAPQEDSGVPGNQSDNSLIDSGAVYVYTRSGNSWSSQAYIKASNPDSLDAFGMAVAVDGNTLVVGAPLESSDATGIGGDELNDNAPASGAVYVFVRSGATWTQQAYIKPSNTMPSYQFGASVAVSGDTLVVGSPEEASNATGIDGDDTDTSAMSSGAAYVFTRNGATWTQAAYVKASNTEAFDRFGSRVAIDGDTIAVSAPQEGSNATGIDGNEADNSALGSGAVYVFSDDGVAWSQEAYVKASNTEDGDSFGSGLALSGETLVVGAPLEDSSATTIGGDEMDNGQPESGAVYVFTRSGATWSQQAYVKASNAEGGTQVFDLADNFGASLSIGGDLLVVASAGEDGDGVGLNANQMTNGAVNSGAAYAFTRSGATWTQRAYVKSSNSAASDAFGAAVAVGGGTFAIGATGEDSTALGVGGNQSNNGASESGAAYVFH